MKLTHALVFALVSAAASVATAATVPDLYITVVMKETIDGEEAKSTRGSTQLLQGLTKAGFRVVDPAGLEGIAGITDPEKLAGRFQEVDWILKVVVDSNKLGEGVMGTSFVRYEAGVEAKLFTADTGEVIGAFNLKGQGMDLQPRAAALMAAEQGATALVKKLTSDAYDLLRQDQRITLRVTEVPDAGEMDRIAKDLPEVLNGLGISIVSTSSGVMSDRQCRAKNVGGELLCTVN